MANKTIIVLLSSILFSVIAVGVVLICICSANFSEIKDQLSRQEAMQYTNNSSLESSLSSTKADIQSMLDKQASLISDYKISYGKPDAASLKGDITLSVTPKEYSDGATAVFYLNDQSTVMTRKANTFIGTITVLMSKRYTASVTFSQNGTNKTETFPEDITYKDRFLGFLYVEMNQRSNESTTFSGSLNYYFHSDFSKASSAKMVALENGKEIWDKYIADPDSEATQAIDFSFDHNDTGNTYVIYVEVVDADGFFYRSWPLGDPAVSSADSTPGDNIVKIYDKNMNEILFE